MKFTNLLKAFESNQSAIEYLRDMGFFKQRKCWKCKNVMTMDTKKELWRCTKSSCRKTHSIYKNTFFTTSKIPLNILLWTCYTYLNKMPIDGIMNTSGVGSEAITAWTKYLRQLLADCVEFKDVVIGGEGVVLEIDETKLGKRKYNRGQLVDGVWVIVGVERTGQKRIFCFEVEDRTEATIERVFRAFVQSGSIIYTDGWKPYESVCRKLNLEHHTVEHKYFFKDPITGVHTNTVEGCNNGIKHLIKPRNRVKKDINDHLFYFIWRRQNKRDLWGGFLRALNEIVY